MSEEARLPQAIACTNCGRTEPRPGVRFCPNCGTLLPGLAGAKTSRTGFAALAQQLPPPVNIPISTERKTFSEPVRQGSQPWEIQPAVLAVPRYADETEEDDLSGPFLTQSLRGDRALGFAGEVAAVLLGAGILVGIGEAASHPNLPDWVSPIILIGGAGLLALCLWQAKRLRETYPQLARGWYAGRSGWITAILSLLLGSVILGLVAILLGPLGWLAVFLGGLVVVTLGPLAWVLLAGIVYLVGRVSLLALRRNRR